MTSSKEQLDQCSVRAVLFDLDDTLFDHQQSSRRGLAVLLQNYQCFQQTTLYELERNYADLLNELHVHVLRGDLSLEEARIERFRRLFLLYSDEVSPTTVEEVALCYRQTYQIARRSVPGSIPLLRALQPRVRIGVITNNLVAEQRDKLQACGLASFIDTLVISEEVGSAKPEPAIFEVALKRLGCRAQEAVMIGDSWSADILGAQRVGMRAIWLNRYTLPCPDATLATEISSFEPLERVLELLFSHKESYLD